MEVTNKKLQVKISNRVQAEYRDSEVEQQLLAYVLQVAPTMCIQLEGDWFTDLIYQEILEIVKDLRIVMTQKLLYRELKSRNLIATDERELYKDTILEIYSVDINAMTAKTALHLMQQVLELFETRRILESAGRIVSDIDNFDLKGTKTELLDLSRPVDLQDARREGYYLGDYVERKEEMQEQQRIQEADEEATVGIPTGITLFDNKTGGVMRKEFGVIAGIPGVGKTAGILSFGLHAFKLGHNVLIVSGEMSKHRIEYRIDSNLAGISGNKFRKAELLDADYESWDSTIQRYSVTHDNYLYVKAYPRRFTFADVEQTILKLNEENDKPVDWVGADYLNIIDPIKVMKSSGGRSGWEQQSEVVWDFKALCEEYDLVGWTGNQVKDEAFAKELYELADLKYGRAIPEASPIVMAMIQTEKDLLSKRMKLQIMKMRNAPAMPRPLELSPNMDLMRLHDNMVGQKKNLGDMTSGFLDIVPETVKTRPARSLKK